MSKFFFYFFLGTVSLMKILLVGGGTGGHILPFVSVVAAAKKKGIATELLVANADLDKNIYHENFNIPVHYLSADKIRRYFSVKNFLAPFKILKSCFDASKILKKSQPDAVFFKGGFVCFPVLVATLWHNFGNKKNRIKIYSHESDTSVGALAKLYAKYADFVFESFGKNDSYPLFFSAQSQKFTWKNIPKTKKLLVMGGSQGAQFLNKSIENNLEELSKNFEICVATGPNKKINTAHKNLQQFELLPAEKLKGALESCDLVLARAGANSLFEILSAKKKSVIVPLPSAARNHQFDNAKYFSEKKLIEMFEQDSNKNLVKTLLETEKNKVIEENLLAENFTNAAKKIIEKIIE